jgi:integrase
MSEERAPNYKDLKAIDGHKNYYRNPLSQKITWKRKSVWIRTGVTQITKAKEIVEAELAKRQGKALPVRQRLRGVPNPPLKDVWDLLLEEKRSEAKPSTMKTYAKNWSVGLEGFWGDKFAQDLNEENIAEYKQWYLRVHPTRHFQKTLIHFMLLAKSLKKNGYIREIPDMSALSTVNETTTKKAKREKPGRVLRPAEQKVLELAAATYDQGDARGLTSEHKRMLCLRIQLAIALGGRCGMRKMEALGLEWSRIDLKNGVAQVWSDKNSKWRDVPLVPFVLELMKLQFELTGTGKYVFPMPTEPSRHITSQVLDKLWVKVKRQASVKGRLRFHDLRHTFASRTADDGWPPKAACAVLDMSLDVYDRVYAKASLEKITEWMRRTFGGAT